DVYETMPFSAGALAAGKDAERAAVQERVQTSARYLADHLHECPVLVIPCTRGRVDSTPSVVQAGFWGSICPAVWSFMLAARARGLGTAWTSLHLAYEDEVARVLGLPDDVRTAVLIPTAY